MKCEEQEELQQLQISRLEMEVDDLKQELFQIQKPRIINSGKQETYDAAEQSQMMSIISDNFQVGRLNEMYGWQQNQNNLSDLNYDLSQRWIGKSSYLNDQYDQSEEPYLPIRNVQHQASRLQQLAQKYNQTWIGKFSNQNGQLEDQIENSLKEIEDSNKIKDQQQSHQSGQQDIQIHVDQNRSNSETSRSQQSSLSDENDSKKQSGNQQQNNFDEGEGQQSINPSLNESIKSGQILANFSSQTTKKRGIESQQISQQSDWSQQMQRFVIRQTAINDTVIVGFTRQLSRLLNKSHRNDYSYYSYEVSMVEEEPIRSNVFKAIDCEIKLVNRYGSELLASYYEDESAEAFFGEFVKGEKEEWEEWEEGGGEVEVDQFDQKSLEDVAEFVFKILDHGYGMDIKKETIDKILDYFMETHSQQQIINQIYQSFKLDIRQLPQSSFKDIKDFMKLGQYYMQINSFNQAAQCYLTAIKIADFQYWLYKDRTKFVLIDKSYKNLNMIRKLVKRDKEQKQLCLQYFQDARNFENKCRKIMNDYLEQIERNIQNKSKLEIQRHLTQIQQLPQDEGIQQKQKMQEGSFLRQKPYFDQSTRYEQSHFTFKQFDNDQSNDSIDSVGNLEKQYSKIHQLEI